MKKFSRKIGWIGAILLAAVLPMLLTACSGKDTTLVRVNEVTHSVFYAPQYVAMELGFFEQEGIEIELSVGAGGR